MRNTERITLYVVKRDKDIDEDDQPEGWQGHFLTRRPRRGDVIAGAIPLYPGETETLPGETRAPLRLRVSMDTDFDWLEGKCVLPQKSAQCLCHALNWVRDPAVTPHDTFNPEDSLEDAVIQESRVGGEWRPLSAIREETVRLTPAVLQYVPDAQVLEARYNSHIMGGGEHVALLLLEKVPYVLEWGDSEDGAWHHLRPMEAHNREVTASNREWREQ